MYCPKCGHLQASEAIRFCARCGLPLENITDMVKSGSVPALNERHHPKLQLSPRVKGILQGIAIVPASIGAWLVLDIFYETVLGAGILGGLYAMFTLILLVALMRILYAIFFEEGSVPRKTARLSHDEAQSELSIHAADVALPAQTSEIVQPLSITEKTTRQLDTHR